MPCSTLDLRERRRWRQVVEKLVHISPALPTHISTASPMLPPEASRSRPTATTHLSCIDRAYLDVENWCFPFMLVAANRVEPPCLGGISDHVPIYVRITSGLQERRASHKRVIPRYVLESPVFVETFDALLSESGVDLDRLDPFRRPSFPQGKHSSLGQGHGALPGGTWSTYVGKSCCCCPYRCQRPPHQQFRKVDEAPGPAA